MPKPKGDAMRKSKRVSLDADQKHLMELLKEYGIPMAAPDHPVYSTGPSIRLQPASPIPDSDPENEEEEMSESAKDILRQILLQ
jgi:hypothetical protein